MRERGSFLLSKLSRRTRLRSRSPAGSLLGGKADSARFAVLAITRRALPISPPATAAMTPEQYRAYRVRLERQLMEPALPMRMRLLIVASPIVGALFAAGFIALLGFLKWWP